MAGVGLPRNEQPIIRIGSEVKKMVEGTRLLPVVILNGREFLVDIENKRFIETNDLNCYINMHSKRGRDMVNEMAGVEWRCFGVYPGKQDGMEV